MAIPYYKTLVMLPDNEVKLSIEIDVAVGKCHETACDTLIVSIAAVL